MTSRVASWNFLGPSDAGFSATRGPKRYRVRNADRVQSIPPRRQGLPMTSSVVDPRRAPSGRHGESHREAGKTRRSWRRLVVRRCKTLASSLTQAIREGGGGDWASWELRFKNANNTRHSPGCTPFTEQRPSGWWRCPVERRMTRFTKRRRCLFGREDSGDACGSSLTTRRGNGLRRSRLPTRNPRLLWDDVAVACLTIKSLKAHQSPSV